MMRNITTKHDKDGVDEIYEEDDVYDEIWQWWRYEANDNEEDAA